MVAFPDLDVKDFTLGTKVTIKGHDLGSSKTALAHVLYDASGNPINVAHDAADAGAPMKLGGYAKAAAPADVSGDADRVNAWFQRNGALCINLTAAGALIPGDATNGLDVDVLRIGGQSPAYGSGANGATVPRVALATDSPGAGITVKASANFTCPNNTSHAANDNVSDNSTAGSVTKMQFSVAAVAGTIRRVKIRKSDQTVATPTIRVWFWDATFTVASGDDAAFSQPLQDSIGFVDVACTNAGTDDATGWTSCDVPFAAGTVFALLQTLSTFVVGASEVFTVEIHYTPGS